MLIKYANSTSYDIARLLSTKFYSTVSKVKINKKYQM